MKPREIIHIRFTPPGVINDRTLTRLGWAASRVALIRLIGSTSKDYYRDGMIRIETRRIIRFFSHQFRSSLPIRCLSSSVIRFQISYLEIGKIPLSKWRNFTDRNSRSLRFLFSFSPNNFLEISIENFHRPNSIEKKRDNRTTGRCLYMLPPIFFRFFPVLASVVANDAFASRLFTIVNEDRE